MFHHGFMLTCHFIPALIGFFLFGILLGINEK